jgi:cytochrome P450
MEQQRYLDPNGPDIPQDVVAFWQNPIETLKDLHAKYGPVVAFDPKDPSSVSITDPKLVQELMTNPDRFAYRVTPITPLPNTSVYRLLFSFSHMDHIEHPQHRQPVARYMRRDSVRGSLAEFKQQIDDYINSIPMGESCDIDKHFQTLLGRLSIGTFFGKMSFEEMDTLRLEVDKWFGHMGDPTAIPVENPVPGSSYDRLVKFTDQHEKTLIAEIDRERANPGTHPLIRTMLEMKVNDQPLSDEMMASHLNLMIAATTTLGFSLSWTAFLMTQFPEWTERMRAEVERVIPGEEITLEQLDQLDIISRFYKESLRLFPPPAILTRRALFDTTLGDYKIQKDAKVFVCSHLIQRDEVYFPDGQSFDPDRWIDATPSPYVYLPFGAGPHICLGMRWAQAVANLLIARLLKLRTFKAVANTEVNWELNIASLPANFRIELQPADQPFELNTVTGNVHGMVNLPVAAA